MVPASCSDKSRLLAARCFLLLDLIEHVTVTDPPRSIDRVLGSSANN